MNNISRIQNVGKVGKTMKDGKRYKGKERRKDGKLGGNGNWLKKTRRKRLNECWKDGML